MRRRGWTHVASGLLDNEDRDGDRIEIVRLAGWLSVQRAAGAQRERPRSLKVRLSSGIILYDLGDVHTLQSGII